MVRKYRYRNLSRALAVAGLSTFAAAAVAPGGPAGGDVSAVSGSAYGYFSSVSLFGGPAVPKGPAPSVSLPAGGSATPLTGSVASASAVYGPAVIFKSGAIEVSTQGAPGPNGSATSSVKITGAADGPGPFLYQGVTSTCTARESGMTASTTLTGAKLETKYDPATQEPTVVEDLPASPPPNFEKTGTIDHVGDHFRIVFNEQVTNPDGSLTVNAAHLYLLGPIAIGELVVGRSVCGMTASGGSSTATTAPASGGATTTVAGSATTTTAGAATGSVQTAAAGSGTATTVPTAVLGAGASRSSTGAGAGAGGAAAATAATTGAAPEDLARTGPGNTLLVIVALALIGLGGAARWWGEEPDGEHFLRGA